MSPEALTIAKHAMPILVYYASVLQKPLTYGELGNIIHRHQRVFGYPFDYIHRWVEMLSEEMGEPIPPIPLLVFEKDSDAPAQKAVDWWLQKTGHDVGALGGNQKQVIMKGITENIIDFPRWPEVLARLELSPFNPPLRPVSEVTQRLLNAHGQGESAAHKQFKEYIARNLSLVGIRDPNARVTMEYTFPSLDRADIWVETKTENVAIEVKSSEANDDELTRGMYQCLKYEALANGVRKETGRPTKARAILAIQGHLNVDLQLRKALIGICIYEGL